MNPNGINDTKIDKIFATINHIVLTILLIVFLYPLIYIVSSSFSSADAVTAGEVWLWPVDFSLEGYKAVFAYKQIWTGYGNSLFYMIVGTFINITLTILAAYPLSRKDFYGRNFFMLLFLFTMLFSGGLIPNYLLVKELGMLNTRWAMIIPNAMSVFNVIITRTYFKMTIPDELHEAAKMDGCSDFRFLAKVVLPLSGPIIAVMGLFYAVGHWNAFFNALIYLRDQDYYPLQLVLNNILVQNEVDPEMFIDVESQAAIAGLRELLKYSLIVVASIPVLVIYPFVQKHFVKGVMIGSLKE
ncbi:sugar ABC transporter permease [Virgibacillus soli]|uniref:carbohydrate ABC transporter permease n=1 Tax=Lederbergia galactosidilytica TaxID=217031 RepID=UPI00071302FB|nr:carbohydrate ABC transporter permease [Lederbergia galactosidilytica]KRG15451.1 sugar ABC transporter permease [Virgibacillus soli]MBP1916236.1 multiple sugar transport system permease protein/putative aldouronate transport system permease protein [Lederbergia galactosidilytica]